MENNIDLYCGRVKEVKEIYCSKHYEWKKNLKNGRTEQNADKLNVSKFALWL